MRTPILAITMGDPAGVGPETIVGAWSNLSLHRHCRPFVVGHPHVMRRAAAVLGSRVKVVDLGAPEDALPSPALLPCLNAVGPAAVNIEPGQIDAHGGQAAYDALVLATEFALSARVDGVTTAPLNKAALWRAGHHYPGHTELLAELCGVEDFAMMLYRAATPSTANRQNRSSAAAGLGVVHVTLHMALKDVFAALSEAAVLAKIQLADSAMRRLGVPAPRIGVCALNPHAGECGLFGDEELSIIRPAVEAAVALGLDVAGPLPADSLLGRAHRGEFDAVVAMYHDQGHIALKLAGARPAVNITLGLPIVRTSVAHGTAFDIAWQGRADCRPMVEAIRVAGRLASDTSTLAVDLAEQ